MRRTIRWILAIWASMLMFALLIRAGAPAWHSRTADAIYRGDLDAQMAMAHGADRWVHQDLATHDFRTGSRRFDGEWLFGTYMMTCMGHGQLAIEHPELRAEQAAHMEACIDGMLAEETRAFDRAAWGNDALESFDTDRAHVAYLGYMNLVLSLHRILDIHSPYSALNDRITKHLVRLSTESPTGLLETYPGETYPVDNTAFIASVALHRRATGSNHGEFITAWAESFERCCVDDATGLLVQAVRVSDGSPVDAPRGSGSALGAYFLSFADAGLSARLHDSITRELGDQVGGFGVIREYPRGRRGRGDIDSGPVVFGWGLSATGFALASSRAHSDEVTFRRNYATAHLFGVPVEREDGRGRTTLNYGTGGPIGDSLLFALMTAQPVETWSSP